MIAWELRRCTNPLCLHESVRPRKRRPPVCEMNCTVCGYPKVTLPLCVDASLVMRRTALEREGRADG